MTTRQEIIEHSNMNGETTMQNLRAEITELAAQLEGRYCENVDWRDLAMALATEGPQVLEELRNDLQDLIAEYDDTE